MSRIDQKIDAVADAVAEREPEFAALAMGLPGAARLKGLALRLAREDEDAPTFEILVVDAGGEVVCALGEYHEDEVVAVWRRLGASSGLALMLQNPDGSYLEPYPQIGAVQLGASRHRRRIGSLRMRRPRFLTRRKTGAPIARPLVHREREIFSGARG